MAMYEVIGKDPTRRYLGDGVYASFDGYQTWIHVERDSTYGVSSIALDSSTMAALVDYDKEMRQKQAEACKQEAEAHGTEA